MMGSGLASIVTDGRGRWAVRLVLTRRVDGASNIIEQDGFDSEPAARRWINNTAVTHGYSPSTIAITLDRA